MGALLTSILQGAGRTGADISQGRLDEQDRRLKMLQAQMGLQELQQRMQAQQVTTQLKTPEGAKSFLKGILGRDPTNEELQRYAGVSPPVTRSKYQDVKQDAKGQPWGYNIENGQFEKVPVSPSEEFTPSVKPGNAKTEFESIFAKALKGIDPKLATPATMTDPSKLTSIIQGSSSLTDDEKRQAMAYMATNTTPASQAANRALGYQILVGPRWAALDPKVQARIATARSLAAGTYSNQLTSFNAFLGHAKDLRDYFGKLGNLDARLLNIPLNKAKEYSNSPEIIGVLAKMEPVQKEFESFLLNNRALYETDREDAQRILDPNVTMSQAMEALNSFVHTASIRLGAINASIKRITGADIPDIVEPENGDFLWEMGSAIPGYTGNSTIDEMFPSPGAKTKPQSHGVTPPPGSKIIKWSDVK